MQRAELVDAVRRRTGIADDEAVGAGIEATLATLAERITEDEARQLAAQLPDDVPVPPARESAQTFDADEFTRRVAARARQDVGSASALWRAVLAAVLDAVSDGEARDVLSQLPADLLAGPPLVEGEERLAALVEGRRSWGRTGRPGEWAATTEDGEKRGVILVVAGEYEGRVFRWPTGPTPGPVPEPAHGPQVFADPEEAVAYVESQMGWVAAGR